MVRKIALILKEIVKNVAYASGIFLAGIVIASFLIYLFQAPNTEALTKRKPAQTTIIYDRTGQHVLYEMYGEYNRKVVSHSQIPDSVRIATIAAEDKSFYSHPGIDFLAMARAIRTNVRNGEILQGGSTITQQLARNVFLNRDKTYLRKYFETILAIKIERSFSKDQILDMYLNEVPYGSNAYGIEAASETYFGKPAKNLTLDESAFLAAMTKAPSYYSPYGPNNEALVARQKNILNKIEELNLLPQSETDKAVAENTLSKIVPIKRTIEAPHFVFYVIGELEKKYSKDFLETGGLRIYTSLDYDLQKAAEKSIADGAKKNQSRRASNAALVAINPKSGEILAMVGSKDYFDKKIDGQVNVATMPRQPGSSFKPVIYSTAFENGYQPESLIIDEPTIFSNNPGKPYIPNNYDGSFHGIVTMREALGMSLNIPAIKTLDLVGLTKGLEMAKRLGITTIDDKRKYGLSFAIGSGEVKLLDLTSVFSVFANDGKRNNPQPILAISENNENFYYEKNGEKAVLSPEIARKINSILSDNNARTPIFGANNPLFIQNRPVAAKTGTAQDFRDAWTVGYTPSLAVGVWVGNNDHSPMTAGSDGIYVAAPIWRDFMDKALNRYSNEAFIPYMPSQNIKNEFAMLDKYDEKSDFSEKRLDDREKDHHRHHKHH